MDRPSISRRQPGLNAVISIDVGSRNRKRLQELVDFIVDDAQTFLMGDTDLYPVQVRQMGNVLPVDALFTEDPDPEFEEGERFVRYEEAPEPGS